MNTMQNGSVLIECLKLRFGSSSLFIASTISMQHKRELELIQSTEYISFHVDSYYETRRVLILDFFPSHPSNNKAYHQLREKIKGKSNDLFLRCLGPHSRLQESFRVTFQSTKITILLSNHLEMKEMKYVVSRYSVKDFSQAE